MNNSRRILSAVLLLCLAIAATVVMSSCDIIFGKEPTPEHQHSLSEVAEVAATCTEAGTKAYYTCSGCDKLFADAEGSVEIEAPKVIEASGHDYKKTVYPNSCTEAGYTKYTCFNCDHSYTADEVAEKGHSFTDYKSNNDATCTEDGTKTAKCDDCSETDTKADEGSKKGHTYGDAWVSDENGHWHVCANGCGIKGDEASHTPNIEAATEFDSKFCTVCDFVIQSALGHTTHNYTIPQKDETHHWNKCYGCNEIDEKIAHDYEENIVENATCTESGSKTLTCDCGHSKSETIPALSHEEQLHDAKAPTCTEIGWNAYVTCSRCDYSTYEAIPATDHDYKATVTAPTCEAQGYTTYVCGNDESHTYVDNYVDALGHSYGEWTVATNPTYDVEGALSGVCGVCSDVETKNIGVISADNDFTLVFTGVLSRWQYAIDGQTFTFDITENAVTTDYLYGLESFYIGTNASGSMIFKSGYKHTNATQPKYGCCFMDGSGKTYTTTVVVPETISVTLLVKAARNKALTYSDTFSSLTVNGEAAAIINTTSATLNFADWHEHNYYEIATIVLEKGTNVIEFKSKANTNFAGIGFKATKEVHMHTDVIDPAVAPTCSGEGKSEGLHCSTCNAVIVAQESVAATGHINAWTHTMTTIPTYTAEGLIESVEACTVCGVVNATDSFSVPVINKDTEGYELLVTGVASRWQYTYDGAEFIIDVKETDVIADNYSFGVEAWYTDRNDTGTPIGLEGFKYTTATWNGTNLCYGKAEKTYTTTIVVDKPTAVTLLITAARNKARPYFSDTGAEHVLDWIKVNGSEANVIYDKTAQLSSTSWYGWKTAGVATLFLEEGTNVISFDTSTNTNFQGIGFISTEEIKLAEDSLTLDLMSFNIRTDADSGVKSWAQRKDALIASIIARNPSVVCFQEVKPGQYNDLAAGLTDYTVVWYSRQGENGEGLAIAYKTAEWNEISKQRFWLSETPDVQSKGWDESYYRIAVNVLLQHKTTGQYLNVFTVHLGLTATSQVNGMQLILDEAQKYDYPTFIAGDFNCTDASNTYANTANLYRDTQKYAFVTESDDTFQSWGGKVGDGQDYIIDFCFVSNEHFAALEFDICQDKWGENNANYLSDHYALITKVALLIPHTHNEKVDEAVDADCVNTGLTEGKHCTSCGKILVAQNTVDALGHTEVVDEGTAPTCTATGISDGKHCSVCDEILVSQTVVDALGHDYDNDADESCNRCEFVRDIGCSHANKVAISEAKDATCTEPGNTAGEKCADCGEVFVEQEIFEALGHTEVIDAAVAADCTNTGLTEGSHCSVCNEVLVAQTVVDALGHTNAAAVMENEVAPTFDAAGSFESVTYCSVCNSEISRVTTALPALNFTDYTSATTASGSTVTTTFSYNGVEYSTSIVTDDYLSVDGVLYSRHEMPKLCDGNVTASYDATNGYSYHAASEKMLSGLTIYGQNLTLTGNISIDTASVITITGGNLYIGIDENTVCYLKVKSSVTNSITISEGANRMIQVRAGSTLDMSETTGATAIRLGYSSGGSGTVSKLDVYGTLITNKQISFNRRHELIVREGGSLECGSINNGKYNKIYVYGKMTVNGNVAQTDSASVTVNNGGTLEIAGNLSLKTNTVNVTNGTLTIGGNLTGASTFNVGATGKCYITGTANMAPTVTDGGYALIGGTSYGTAPAASEEEASE